MLSAFQQPFGKIRLIGWLSVWIFAGCAEETRTPGNRLSPKFQDVDKLVRHLEYDYRPILKAETDFPYFATGTEDGFYDHLAYWMAREEIVEGWQARIDQTDREVSKRYGAEDGKRMLQQTLLRLQQKYGTTFHGLAYCLNGEKGMDGFRASCIYVKRNNLKFTPYARYRLDYTARHLNLRK